MVIRCKQQDKLRPLNRLSHPSQCFQAIQLTGPPPRQPGKYDYSKYCREHFEEKYNTIPFYASRVSSAGTRVVQQGEEYRPSSSAISAADATLSQLPNVPSNQNHATILQPYSYDESRGPSYNSTIPQLPSLAALIANVEATRASDYSRQPYPGHSLSQSSGYYGSGPYMAASSPLSLSLSSYAASSQPTALPPTQAPHGFGSISPLASGYPGMAISSAHDSEEIRGDRRSDGGRRHDSGRR